MTKSQRKAEKRRLALEAASRAVEKEKPALAEPALTPQILSVPTAKSHEPSTTDIPKKSFWEKGLPAIVAICTAAQASFAYLQWRVTESGGAQTDKIIATAEQISKSLEGSLKQSERALATSIEVSRTDQRAWLGIRIVDLAPMEAGKPLRVESRLANSGKTPALKLVYPGMLHLSEKPMTGKEILAKYDEVYQTSTAPTLGSLLPGDSFSIPITGSTLLNTETINGINAGIFHLYLIGSIRYIDIFEQPHFSNYLMHYLPALKKFELLPSHNDVNQFLIAIIKFRIYKV